MISSIRIPLNGKYGQGLFALVDAHDVARVAPYRWIAIKKVANLYARTVINGRHVYMHHLIASHKPRTDHKNGNGLDNRRENLRPATGQANMRNGHKRQSTAKSIYKGVARVMGNNAEKRKNCWFARLSTRDSVGERRSIYLGVFPSEESAAYAYDTAARKYFGKFARLNFPKLGEQSALRKG